MSIGIARFMPGLNGATQQTLESTPVGGAKFSIARLTKILRTKFKNRLQWFYTSLEQTMTTIKVGIHGHVAQVDDADILLLGSFTWSLLKVKHLCYAVHLKRVMVGTKASTTAILMHRFLTKAPSGMDVDHINGDGLDNRRCNLRVCSRAENLRNARVGQRNTSGYKGVSWHSTKQVWRATIMVNYKTIRLGEFKNLQDAVAARKEAERKHFGMFAR